MFKFIAAIVCATMAFNISLNAQDTLKYKLDEITVTAGRVPVTVSEASRVVKILTAKDFETLAIESPVDLLQYVNGVDLKQRGTDGIQADINIRGGTFEQTLVMIDGIPINDPQTGHHTMNLPIALADIERIELLKGQASKSFGPNAFAGAVNIITKSNAANGVKLSATGGEYGYYNGNISAAYSAFGINNSVTYEKKKSDGYIHNTDFVSEIFSYSNSFAYKNFAVKGFFGYNDKKFGANNFYTDRFPNQWEHTTTKFAKANLIYAGEDNSAELKLFYRRNDDEFLLDYTNPAFYKNNHKTNAYGAEVQLTFDTDMGTTAIGGEFLADDIKSNNLGEHSRTSNGIFVEHIFSPIKNMNLTVGGFIYNYDRIGWKIWPGFDFNYSVSQYFKVFASVGKAFRIPSYTELYYNDPATTGNANLQSEETLNSEIGLSYSSAFVTASATLFNNQGRNIIDWIRINPGGKWLARNISKVITNGMEFSLKIYPGNAFALVKRIELDYTHIASDKESANFDSRYAIEFLRNQVNLRIVHKSLFGVIFNWALRYEDRINLDNALVTDIKLNKNFRRFNLFVSATNLFDINYFDVNGVLLPGRWIRTGINFEF